MPLPHPFQPIAVIGRGCHLPGASSIAEYWNVIRDDLPTIHEIPNDRFDRELLYDQTPGVDFKTYCSKACLVKPISADRRRDLPLKWKHHPETVITDLISVTQDACRDAGRELEGWAGLRGGVFLGHTRGGSLSGDLAYAQYVAQAAELIDHLIDEVPSASTTDVERWKSQLVSEVRSEMPSYAGKANPTLGAPVAAMAVADSLCWDGPFMAFNGACASSLQALHAATLSLQTGRVDIAVAAGASCCHSDSLVLFAQARSLSSSDTRPFDDAADGLIIGEGCVVLLLKRLDDAIRDGDKIRGVIRGVGVASDGKGKSLWAPRKEGQMLAIDRAYSSKSEMARVQYIEAHATSTQVGDATEMDALASAFKGVFPSSARIPVGSVKGNVGHTLESAGLAGLLKTLLCMENGVYPSHQRLKNLSKKIPWNTIQFHVPQTNTVWETDANGERWAAINGFGIGGLNAHVVVQSGRIREEESISGTAPADSSITKTFSVRSASNTGRSTSPSRTQEYDIAVISTGCILPGALDWNAFLKISNSRERATKPLPKNRWLAGPDLSRTSIEPMASTFGGFIDNFAYDWRRHKVPPKQIASASPLQFMILEAVDQAIRPSGILDNAESRTKTGVVVGTIFGGDFSNQLQMGLRVLDLKKRLNCLWMKEGFDQATISRMLNRFTSQLIEKMPAIFDETGSFTSSSLASRITKSFDLMGGAVAVDAAHGASGAAIAYCVDQLQHSDNRFMVCVGAQQDMGPMKFEGWTKHGWLGSDPSSTALQANDRGSFPGEGAGVLLLQKLRKDEKPVLPALAYIRGIGTSYQRWGDCSFKNSLERAFEQTIGKGSFPSQDEMDVDTIRMSPIGLEAMDASYLEGAGELLDEGNRNVATAIDQFGHLTGGSGIVECLAAIAKCDSSSTNPMISLSTFKNSFWAISKSSHRAMERNVVYMGNPWECVYSVVFDVLKRNND